MIGPSRFRRASDDSVADDLVLDGLEEHEVPQIAALLGGLRDLAARHPTPTAALEDVLVGGIGPEQVRAPAMPAAPPGRRIARVVAAKVAGLGLLAQVGVGVAAASAITVGAATTDRLPGPAQDLVAGWVEQVTPFDLPDSADRGQRIADDARTEPRGVDGREVASEVAEVPANQPPVEAPPADAPPAEPNDEPRGFDVVEQTPAAERATPPYQYWQQRPATPSPAHDEERPGKASEDHEPPADPGASDEPETPDSPASENRPADPRSGD